MREHLNMDDLGVPPCMETPHICIIHHCIASLFVGTKWLYFLEDVHILSNGFQDIPGHPKRHLAPAEVVGDVGFVHGDYGK